MKNVGYFVKFNNFASHPDGTGKLHIEVLQKNGQVIWGQWRSGINILNEGLRKVMNENPFYFYAMDKKIALLKMKCIKVLTKEEVIEQHLEYLIPTYYNIDTPCSAYYLIENIEILPPVSGKKIINSNTRKSIYDAVQVNSTIPWKVEEIDTDLGIEDIDLEQSIITSKVKCQSLITETTNNTKEINNKYSVYKYHSILTGKDYIGLTNNVDRRRKQHENPAQWKKEKKKYLYTFMQLLGLEDFEFSILHENLTKEEAHYWEAKEIENHNAYFPNGFNERNESIYLL